MAVRECLECGIVCTASDRARRPLTGQTRWIASKENALKRIELGPLYYEISRHNPPRTSIDPGETLVVETEDAFSGQVRTESDRRDRTTVPYSNPQTGPDRWYRAPSRASGHAGRFSRRDGRMAWHGRSARDAHLSSLRRQGLVEQRSRDTLRADDWHDWDGS